ncbi:MAG: polysaccharide deacetylase family protein [Bdellovibrionales bacterium]|nr:polysaccharide deacetylase family protein [Oligoflexia bacterium]
MNLFWAHLLPERRGIPVLMYHKVEECSSDSLTVSVAAFKSQLAWLKDKGYSTISAQTFVEFLNGRKKRAELPRQPVLITFDDGYDSTLIHAAPAMNALGFQAILFATSSYIETGKSDRTHYMSVEELKIWQEQGHEIALHSHAHPNYRQIANTEIMEDLRENQAWFKAKGIQILPVLAYPYGARPQERARNADLKASLKKSGLVAAFRIGNRIPTWASFEKNSLDAYEVPRIDIRGDDTLASFAIKLKKGRLRPFQ